MARTARRCCSILFAITVLAGTTATLPGSAGPAPLGAPVNGTFQQPHRLPLG